MAKKRRKGPSRPGGSPQRAVSPQPDTRKKLDFIPWSLLLLVVSLFLLLATPLLGDLAATDAKSAPDLIVKLASLIALSSLVNALVVAEFRAMYKGESLRAGAEVRRLASLALNVTGVGALWGSSLGIVVAAESADVSTFDAIGSLATAGVVMGLLVCVPACERVYFTSFRELRGSLKYLTSALLVSALTFYFTLAPALGVLGRLRR